MTHPADTPDLHETSETAETRETNEIADFDRGWDELFSTTLASTAASPLELLHRWYIAAEADPRIREPRSAAIATFEAETGMPDSRIVYLRPPAASGIVFFTDRSSSKGRHLASTPAAAATWLWHDAFVQIRARGTVVKTSRDEDLTYWQSRPQANRLAGLTSLQSQSLENEAERENLYAAARAHFGEDSEIPLPERWGGFRLQPVQLEFWRGTPHRLHRRMRLEWTGEGTPNLASLTWQRTLLQP
ncbi:MAG: pyridoxal 5'-phosphate synthase [Microbacteriaceae bacterium]|nr:pyridoxal 5'-phosphate synthase [Microbacteriaceae bacterium]